MKNCSDCQTEKELTLFYKNKRSPDGHCNRCKECDKARKRDSEYKEYRRSYLAKNKEMVNSYFREYAKENRDKFNEHQRNYYYNHYEQARALINAIGAKRRAIKLNATFDGYDKQLKEIYANCPPGFHVDHIIPLVNDLVCGLHVPWNLQYLPAQDNLKKGNKVG